MGIKSQLTICFEEPFWVGIIERAENTKYEVCKVTFGSEPRDCEVYDYFLKNRYGLKFSPSIEAVCLERRISPKRMQRTITRMLREKGIGTKAQQALKLQQEQLKLEQKAYRKEKRETAKEQKFFLRQEKRREKHKGH